MGIDIKIHWTFLLFVVFELLRAPDVKFQALFLAILFITVLVHEFGHCLGARHFGVKADRVLLWPFGGLAFVGGGRDTKEEFWITFWGPFVHLPIGLLAAGWLAWQGAGFHFQMSLLDPVGVSLLPTSWGALIVYLILKVQVWLFALNVFLPAYPMDGGRMLVATMLPRWGALKTSLVAMVLTCVCACYLLANDTSFIAFFLLMEAAQLYQMRQTGMIYQHPSFSRSAQPIASQPRNKASKARQVSHLRLVVGGTKQCPQCGRSLPEAAKMCGFCEIVV
jgi:Zn-dependent protease